MSCDHGNDDYYDDYYWHHGKCVTTFITDYINTNLANSEVYVTLCGCMYLLIKDFVLLHSNPAFMRTVSAAWEDMTKSYKYEHESAFIWSTEPKLIIRV